MNTILTNIVRFASGSTLGGIFSFLTAFLVAKLVGPEKWGIWMIFNIILKFSPFIQLGVSESIQRRIPILIAEGEIQKAYNDQNNANSFTWIMGIILVLLFIFLGPSLLNIKPAYCYVFAPVLLFNLVSYNIGILFRSYNKFKQVGLVSFLSGFFSVISIILAYKFSFLGFLIGQLVRYFLTLLVNLMLNNTKLSFGIKRENIASLILDGSPILLIVLSNYLVTLSDRLIIANLFNDESLGLYGLAYLVINPLVLVSGSVNSVFYTSFSSSYGKDKNFFSVKKILKYTNLLIFVYTSFIGVIYISIPLITEKFLVEYEAGIDTARLLLIGHIFYFSGGIVTNAYFALNKQKKRLLIIVLSLLINVGVSLFLLKYNPDIISVAIGSVCSFLFLFVWLLFGLNFVNPIYNWDQIKHLLFSLVFLIVGILAVTFISSQDFHEITILDAFIKLLVFITSYSMFSFLYNKSDFKKILNESKIFSR